MYICTLQKINIFQLDLEIYTVFSCLVRFIFLVNFYEFASCEMTLTTKNQLWHIFEFEWSWARKAALCGIIFWQISDLSLNGFPSNSQILPKIYLQSISILYNIYCLQFSGGRGVGWLELKLFDFWFCGSQLQIIWSLRGKRGEVYV